MSSKELINVLSGSAIRRDILIQLTDGPKTRSDLRSCMDVTSPQLSHNIRELVEQDLVRAEGKNYSLTPWGYVIVRHFKSLVQTIDLYEDHKKLWETKNLNYLPEELRLRVGEIGKCSVTEDTSVETDYTLREIREVVQEAKYVFGVSPLFMDELVSIFAGTQGKKIKYTIVITESIYNKVMTVNPQIIDQVKMLLDIELYVIADGHVPGLIVTDKHLLISAFEENGEMALHCNLSSGEESAVRWGKDLFDYYKQRSRKI